ncbi:unnamed protein product, partial [Timema podura]|nr:unnamed protein product [Timema podura]
MGTNVIAATTDGIQKRVLSMMSVVYTTLPTELKVCDSPLDLTLLQPSAKGIEFVQLSQNIQKAIGEPVQMHCRINKAVEECQWTWKPINETIKTPEVKRRFQPAGDERRDCSIRLKMLLQEEEGIWTCGVRLHKNYSFTEASPTTVTSFPP